MRFSEFFDFWKNKAIIDIGKVITGNTPPTKNSSYYGDSFNWAGPSDLGMSKYINDTKVKLSNDGMLVSRVIPKNSILVTCIGSTIGKMGISTKEMATNQQINSIIVNTKFNFEFIYYEILYSFKKYLKTIEVQAVPIISKSAFERLKIYVPSIDEQHKLAKFLTLIDHRIDTQSKIIEDLECQINYIRRKLFTGYINDDIYNQKHTFNKIFISYKKLNEQSLQQYTIGKNGIKSMSNHLNYSINSHIVFMPNTLILGIGIDEIGVSIDTTGCCSPIYKTYKINNEIVDTLFLNIFANDYFSMIKNRVTQKSTRREFEFDYKELSKTLFTLPDIETQKRDAQIVNKFYFKLQKEKDILELYKKQKAYLLKNMFI